VFQNRVLRRIFGPKRKEIMGEWRKLPSGKLRNLYSSPNIIRQIKSKIMSSAGHVARMGRGEKRVLGFGGKARRKRPLGRPRRRWEDGIEMYITD
jgi:hypothetical protein